MLFGWAIVLLASLGVFTRWCIGERRGWLIGGVGALLKELDAGRISLRGGKTRHVGPWHGRRRWRAVIVAHGVLAASAMPT